MAPGFHFRDVTGVVLNIEIDMRYIGALDCTASRQIVMAIPAS